MNAIPLSLLEIPPPLASALRAADGKSTSVNGSDSLSLSSASMNLASQGWTCWNSGKFVAPSESSLRILSGSLRAERVCASAQRLSASSEFALFRCQLAFRFLLVLNAFRHHRNSHANTITYAPTFNSCSTPFGIIGIRTFHPQLIL